jgi:hypothetical protein
MAELHPLYPWAVWSAGLAVGMCIAFASDGVRRAWAMIHDLVRSF